MIEIDPINALLNIVAVLIVNAWWYNSEHLSIRKIYLGGYHYGLSVAAWLYLLWGIMNFILIMIEL